jgi:hypothetical protein
VKTGMKDEGKNCLMENELNGLMNLLLVVEKEI